VRVAPIPFESAKFIFVTERLAIAGIVMAPFQQAISPACGARPGDSVESGKQIKPEL
jgi:hypothetical protein